MTEEQAKLTRCCGPEGCGLRRREDLDRMRRERGQHNTDAELFAALQLAPRYCIGSACMGWRWRIDYEVPSKFGQVATSSVSRERTWPLRTGRPAMTDIKTPAEMRELLGKTTQGYWQARRAGNCRLLSGEIVGQSSLHPVPRPYEPRWIGYSNEATALQWHHTTVLTDEDADFIAAAHNSMSHYLDVMKEQAEAILELQREACARDGVPMPSERPLVDKLRDRIEKALREIGQLRAAAYTMLQFARDANLAGCTTGFGVFMRREEAIEKCGEIIKSRSALAPVDKP